MLREITLEDVFVEYFNWTHTIITITSSRAEFKSI